MMNTGTQLAMAAPDLSGWFWWLSPLSPLPNEPLTIWITSAHVGVRPIHIAVYMVLLVALLVVTPYLRTRRYHDCPKAVVSWLAGAIVAGMLLVELEQSRRVVPVFVVFCALSVMVVVSLVFVLGRWARALAKLRQPS